ncbi:hypothetical protein ACL02O_34235 [Micromonospora sp. MS34]|uniref:hypothetical protein n=1 Tax=Micromonospora sp. MS34 TaxID=3385971 RepID=UPI0039A0C56F
MRDYTIYRDANRVRCYRDANRVRCYRDASGVTWHVDCRCGGVIGAPCPVCNPSPEEPKMTTTDLICTERLVIPTFNAEFVPEEDQGPCAGVAVARVVIEHDGEKCGDGGLCLFDPEEGLELALWRQTRLLCPTTCTSTSGRWPSAASWWGRR